MRRLPFVACALTLLAAPIPASAAGTVTGGVAAPTSGGGATDGRPVQKVRRASRKFLHQPQNSSPRRSRPIAKEFGVVPGVLDAGTAATFTYRVDGPQPAVRVRIDVTPSGATAPIVRIRLGRQRTGVRHTHVWAPAAGELPAGEHTVTLQAFDDAGRALRRTARASGQSRVLVRVAPPPVAVGAGRFPVQGAYSFGGPDARFGAARETHVHQGQDVTAAEGTPIVAPVAGAVYWVAFQRRGAGHYVVLRAIDGNDYVFMHLRAGSVTAVEGATLAAGQAFAQVGSTGASSGPHLHFEIWPDGWYSSKSSAPIDPLPQLLAWAATR